MNFGSKLFPLECTQAKKLTDGRLGRPHIWQTMDIAVSQKLSLSKLRWANKNRKQKIVVYLLLFKAIFLDFLKFKWF